MKKLSYPIPSAKLRRFTHLRPKLKNDTSWSSLFEMLGCYTQIKSFLHSVDLPDVRELLFDESKKEKIDRLLLWLKDLESFTKALQANDVGLGEVHVWFYGVI